VADAFRNYAPLVPVGSYVVVEDTILEGNPVWAGFGPGPAVAVEQIVDAGEFVRDPSLERFGLTFNVGGFLKRVR
jgi:cephalosporin hydroxylase